nr:ulp1 protease family, C-terminal catalytic domain-containing protein [Tanacetum cinerariifolium]
DAILVKRKEDDCEDDKVGDAMLEKEVYEAHPDDEKVREAVLDSEENNTDKYSIAAISVQGKEDDCVEIDDILKYVVRLMTDNKLSCVWFILQEQITDNVVELKRKRYVGKACKSPYMEKPLTNLTVPKRRFKRIYESDIMPIPFAADDGVIDVDVWTEDHYFLAVLQIRDGVVTFYDSIGIPPQETRHDFLKMRVTLELALPKYLDLVRVFKAKGIPIEDDKITFPLGENVPIQAEPYGDCGVWAPFGGVTDWYPEPRGGVAIVASPVKVLELDTHSSLEADPSESSPPPVSVAPMVLPFLCLDDSESDTKIPKRHAPFGGVTDWYPEPRGGVAIGASPVKVLELDTHSSLEADPSESSPPPVSVAPMVLPFLCLDDSESNIKIPKRNVSPTPHDAMLTR